MNDTNTKDYMIDVAQDTTYQNQSDDIRSRLQSGVQILRILLDSSLYIDTREHSYIDGEGFVPH